MTTEDIFITIDEVEGDIYVMKNELIPDLEATLAYLTDPSYKPETNPDHEYREQDIDSCVWGLLFQKRDLRASREKLGKLYRRVTQMELDSGTSSSFEG